MIINKFAEFKNSCEELNKRSKILPYRKKLWFMFYSILETFRLIWVPYLFLLIALGVFIILDIVFKYNLPTVAILYSGLIMCIFLVLFAWFKAVSSKSILNALEKVESAQLSEG